MPGKRRAPRDLKRFERHTSNEGFFDISKTQDGAPRKGRADKIGDATESVPPLAPELRPLPSRVVTREQLGHYSKVVGIIFGILITFGGAMFWFGRLDARVDNIRSDLDDMKSRTEKLTFDVGQHAARIESLERQSDTLQASISSHPSPIAVPPRR
jgi:tetrahydromethanopterin S-methyltransferase subunit B